MLTQYHRHRVCGRALGFLLGPFLGTLWRIGVMRLEEDFSLLPKENKKI